MVEVCSARWKVATRWCFVGYALVKPKLILMGSYVHGIWIYEAQLEDKLPVIVWGCVAVCATAIDDITDIGCSYL